MHLGVTIFSCGFIHILVGMWGSRMPHVGCSHNKLECVFMVMKEYVSQCNSDSMCY